MNYCKIQVEDVVDFLPDATLAVDKNRHVIIWNRAIERLTGVPATEMLGKGEYAYTIPFHGQARPLLIDLLFTCDKELPPQYEGITRDGDSLMGEVFCQSLKNGNGAWVYVKAAPLHDDSGEIIGAIEIIRDITAQKLSELYSNISREILVLLTQPCNLKVNLQRVITLFKDKTGFGAVGIRLQNGDDYPYLCSEGFSEDFLTKERSILSHSADGVVCRDKDGNACLECICGTVITGNAVPAPPLFTHCGSLWINDTSLLLELYQKQDILINPLNECIIRGYLSVALIPIRNEERIIGLLQLNDIRKNQFTLEVVKQIEIICSHIGSLLIHKRSATEKRKLEQQLNKAQKLESVGLLAGGIAHDFNNMLCVILGYTQLASMENDLPKQIDEWIQEIRKAALHSADITRQLLTFARQQPTTPIILKLDEVVPSVLKMIQKLIGEDITVTLKMAPDPWLIKCDPTHISTILVNLCINSRDAIYNTGNIIINVDNRIIDSAYCKNRPDITSGEYLRIVIDDNGSGMSQETIDKIFDPFFTTKEMGKGTGLGLSMVFGIVNQNNGFIEVSSELGLGTTFTIYLPRYTGITSQTSAGYFQKSAKINVETILLVEDEPAILNMSATMLLKKGYTVLKSDNPTNAISQAKMHNGDIDILITDVIMPNMNGNELSVELKKLYPEIKCLFMSGYTSDILDNHGVKSDDLFFIHKPFDLNIFSNKVRDVLDFK